MEGSTRALAPHGDAHGFILARHPHVINFDEALRVAIDGERGQPSTVYERD